MKNSKSNSNMNDVNDEINTYLDPVDAKASYKKRDQKLKSFADLLDSISSLEDKKKVLWKEIYENAITDRENAYMLYSILFVQISNKDETTHSILGMVMNKYMERMSKATDQLIRLAELLADAEKKQDNFDPSTVYGEISDS